MSEVKGGTGQNGHNLFLNYLGLARYCYYLLRLSGLPMLRPKDVEFGDISTCLTNFFKNMNTVQIVVTP